jgi:hypothetical protein
MRGRDIEFARTAPRVSLINLPCRSRAIERVRARSWNDQAPMTNDQLGAVESWALVIGIWSFCRRPHRKGTSHLSQRARFALKMYPLNVGGVLSASIISRQRRAILPTRNHRLCCVHRRRSPRSLVGAWTTSLDYGDVGGICVLVCCISPTRGLARCLYHFVGSIGDSRTVASRAMANLPGF